jgi:FdhD protein
MQGCGVDQANGSIPRQGSALFEAIRYSDGEPGQHHEPVAEEVPVALLFNGFTFAVMLASPTDLEDLAVGFSLTEEIVANADEIASVAANASDEGVELRITLPRERYMALRERHRRSLAAGTSCGLCGTDSFSEALRPLGVVPSAQRFAPPAIWRAMAELPAHQQLNHDVGSVHAAAFVAADGHILEVREDVGRHNALDKLIGCLARRGTDMSTGFVAVSSRCSYEMVHKTAAAGIPLIAAVSAPTAMAIKLAEATGVGLAAYARDGRFTLYACPSRVEVQP